MPGSRVNHGTQFGLRTLKISSSLLAGKEESAAVGGGYNPSSHRAKSSTPGLFLEEFVTGPYLKTDNLHNLRTHTYSALQVSNQSSTKAARFKQWVEKIQTSLRMIGVGSSDR